jgi:glycosyltransferase involved in cell wall biosynthesis
MTSKVVLFVHWLSPRKGAQYLVKIAKEVSRTIPDVFFIIVGEGPYMETLRQEIAENGLEDSMRLVGSVPNQEIPKYYAAADLLIMPSEEEGFPRVILEAMAMDVPFVATDVGGTKDLMTENQMICIVRRGDMSSFAKKVINILKDNELREVLKREGRERIKHFSKEKVIEIFISNLACKKPN